MYHNVMLAHALPMAFLVKKLVVENHDLALVLSDATIQLFLQVLVVIQVVGDSQVSLAENQNFYPKKI